MSIKGLICSLIILFTWQAEAQDASIWMELAAKDRDARTALATQGFDIVSVEKDRVIVLGGEKELAKASRLGIVLARYTAGLSPFDFPTGDEKFTTYAELTASLQTLAKQNPNLVQLSSLGKTYEGRELWMVRLSAKAPGTAGLPASMLLGGHHAREHVAIDVPLRILQYLVQEYTNQNPRVVSMLTSVEVFVIPMVNPDGAEYDIATGSYRYWRKNRRPNSDGTFGVDLNRNYAFGFGGEGSSDQTSSEIYHGPSAFSEPETQMVRDFIGSHTNIRTLLTYHTFSELVMWPWGGSDDDIPDVKDRTAFETMGKAMAQMNGYTAEKSSALYIATGDLCDWAYAQHGIFAYTFEMDPVSQWDGGFYPGEAQLDVIFNKNIAPTLYLIDAAVDPYSAK